VIYKGQASEMFSGLLSDIRAGVIDQMFRARLASPEEMKNMQEAGRKPQTVSTTTPTPPKKRKKKSRKRH